MGSCFSISVAIALHCNKKSCYSCKRDFKKNRDKYIYLQNKNICNKCIEIRKVDKT